ncbi:MAG TPA: hypothetical protein PLS73_12125 [Saprospiraceae bacterium]|nr:hypothetical protein [Saprospiraceae bacterium]
MFKKRLAIFFLTLANVVLIGHDLIPHHHHDSLEELLAHHHSEQDQTEHGLSHWLSHLMHSSDGLAFSANHSIGSSFSKQQHSIPALLPEMNWINLLRIPDSIQKPPEATRLVSSLQCLPSGLRGPPALFS